VTWRLCQVPLREVMMKELYVLQYHLYGWP
jgi:hypothetical protein